MFTIKLTNQDIIHCPGYGYNKCVNGCWQCEYSVYKKSPFCDGSGKTKFLLDLNSIKILNTI